MSRLTTHKNDIAHSVLDIFLFINPIDPCGSCHINRLMTGLSCVNEKTYFHIIPHVTLQMLNAYIQEKNLPLNDLSLRQTIQRNALEVKRLFKAASFQGKKKARLFLYYLNQCAKMPEYSFTHEALIYAAEKAQLDIGMLIIDKDSQMVEHLMEKDANLAKKYNVTLVPSALVFNSSHDSGILIEQNLSCETILYALSNQKYFGIK